MLCTDKEKNIMDKTIYTKPSLIIIISLLVFLLTSCIEGSYVANRPQEVESRIDEINIIINEQNAEKLLEIFAESYKENTNLKSDSIYSFCDLYDHLTWLKKAVDLNMNTENIDIKIKDLIMSIDAENANVYTVISEKNNENTYEVCFHLIRINEIWYLDNVYIK